MADSEFAALVECILRKQVRTLLISLFVSIRPRMRLLLLNVILNWSTKASELKSSLPAEPLQRISFIIWY